jgi:hypothetical protein
LPVRIGDGVGVAVVLVVVLLVVVDDGARVVEVEVCVEVVEVEGWVEVEEEEERADDVLEEATLLPLELVEDGPLPVVELGEVDGVAEREVVLEVPGAENVVEELDADDRLVGTVDELDALLEGGWIVVAVGDEVPGCETLDDCNVEAEELWGTLVATGEDTDVGSWTLVVLVVIADVAAEDAVLELASVDDEVLVLLITSDKVSGTKRTGSQSVPLASPWTAYTLLPAPTQKVASS